MLGKIDRKNMLKFKWPTISKNVNLNLLFKKNLSIKIVIDPDGFTGKFYLTFKEEK